MKIKVLLLLVFLSSGLYSQNSQSEKPTKQVSTESFYHMQLSVEDQGYLVKPAEVINLMEAAVELASAGKLDTISLIRLHTRCRELMYFGLREKKLQMEEVKTTFQSLDKLLNTILQCDKQQSHYMEIFLKDSTNRRVQEDIIIGLQQCNCQNSDLYMKVAKRLFDKDTVPEKALWLARYFLKKTGYGFALPLLQKAALAENLKIASEANCEIAASYRFYNRQEEAVKFARKALEQNPSNAMAYIIIGDCYYLSAASCGTTDIEKTAALWAAYDKYQKALKTDPSLRDMVRVRMGVLTHRFPTAADINALKLTEGSPYKVGCWIKETTQVRIKK